MLEVLTRVRLKGFQLAIDDFGTGYSSLVQLHRLPFTELKIDQSFVRDMASSEEASVIVGAVINLGRSLRLELVAEGIETEELLQRLITMGCQTGQGYLFSRPMPASEVADWIATHPPHQNAPSLPAELAGTLARAGGGNPGKALPDIDGLALVRKLKADPDTRDIHLTSVAQKRAAGE
jgi:predicted signal transduction protein with EAL and GGDEF domain